MQLGRKPKPIEFDVEVIVVISPPDRRTRDLDNYLKALFDSMTHAGIWKDDSQVKRMAVEWGPVTKGGFAEITIGVYQEVAA